MTAQCPWKASSVSFVRWQTGHEGSCEDGSDIHVTWKSFASFQIGHRFTSQDHIINSVLHPMMSIKWFKALLQLNNYLHTKGCFIRREMNSLHGGNLTATLYSATQHYCLEGKPNPRSPWYLCTNSFVWTTILVTNSCRQSDSNVKHYKVGHIFSH